MDGFALIIIIKGDYDAWFQLSQYYIERGMYQQAVFALEEVLMIKPASHLYILCYADLLTAIGDNDSASKYYAAALEICDCVHAWHGILNTSSNKELLIIATKKLDL